MFQNKNLLYISWSTGHLFKILAKRRGAYWKEGAWSLIKFSFQKNATLFQLNRTKNNKINTEDPQ